MTENEKEPPQPFEGTGPVEAAGPVGVAEDATPPRPRPRGRVAAVVGAVALAGALVAGVGYTVVTVRGADRDAGAPTWKLPKVTAAQGKEPKRHGLAAMLVPYGTEQWVRGPDIGEYGSDAQLSGAQATALRKQSLSGLPRTQRLRLERQIDRQHIKGMAMRSYFSGGTAPNAWNDGISSASVVLSEMGDKGAVRTISTFQNALLDALGGLREGPKIKGHDNARCFRSPKGTDKDLDMMLCSGYVGDILVTVTADAAHPIDNGEVANLMRLQLDRIAEPGEAV